MLKTLLLDDLVEAAAADAIAPHHAGRVLAVELAVDLRVALGLAGRGNVDLLRAEAP